MNKLCSKIDTCYKINMLRDKDMLDFQFAEAVGSVCGKCDDFTVGGGREMTEKAKELEIAKVAWKHFLGAHADECDTDAVVDEIVAKTAELTRKEIVEELGDIWAELQDYLTPSVGSLLMVDRDDLTKIEIRIEALKQGKKIGGGKP